MWRGWWGDEPSYHAPVFVLTHHRHDPVEMEGGTTFHFVDGFETAMERAIAAAGDDTVDHRGRRQRGPAGLRGRRDRRDHAQPRPIVLGRGESTFDDLADLRPTRSRCTPRRRRRT